MKSLIKVRVATITKQLYFSSFNICSAQERMCQQQETMHNLTEVLSLHNLKLLSEATPFGLAARNKIKKNIFGLSCLTLKTI